MIKSASAFTLEIDDIDRACRELKTQIDAKLVLMRNSLGIVQCAPDFIESGIMEKLFLELGIPLAGGTTVTSATNDMIGIVMFSLLVLTSDDVEFTVSHTQGFAGDCKEAIRHSLALAMGKPRKLADAPLRLVLVFPPVIDAVAGDCYVEAVEEACGTVPIFGSLTVDDSLDKFDRSASLINGAALQGEMAYVLFYGNVTPRFLMATTPYQSELADTSAVITRANGNIAYEINNMRAIDYFESIGFAKNGIMNSGAIYVPMLLTLPGETDNIPFVRGVVQTGSEGPDGSVAFKGKMFEGARMTFGSNFGIDVLAASTEAINKIAQYKDINAVLIFSCMIRQLVIGSDSMRELTRVKDILKNDVPFIAAYAGGEISPTSVDGNHVAHNRFHNYTFITCLLTADN